jgi:hypothetical protein
MGATSKKLILKPPLTLPMGQGLFDDAPPDMLGLQKLLLPKHTLFVTKQHPTGEAEMEVFLTVTSMSKDPAWISPVSSVFIRDSSSLPPEGREGERSKNCIFG